VREKVGAVLIMAVYNGNYRHTSVLEWIHRLETQMR